jgi:hypothetical protein
VYHEHGLSLAGPGTSFYNKRSANDTTRTSAAVCRFLDREHSNHFPHALQQLYQCFSYWNQFPPNKTKVLIRPARASGFPDNSILLSGDWLRGLRHNLGFLKGFTTALRDVFDVQFVSDPTTAAGPAVWRADHAHTYYMQSTQDARDLANRIAAYYNVPQLAGCPVNDDKQQQQHQQSRPLLPRVGILNRHPNSKRSLLNVDAMVAAIRDELSVLLQRKRGEESGEERRPIVLQTATFETAAFLEQVAFFQATDLLISPHGAQLTGLPFLPGCGQLLEIFPSHYYYDTFFGSLADSSGITVHHLYLSEGDPVAEWSEAENATRAERRAWRSVNLCPPVTAIRQAINTMTALWTECCQKREQEEEEDEGP